MALAILATDGEGNYLFTDRELYQLALEADHAA
jgi:hypothetical protein